MWSLVRYIFSHVVQPWRIYEIHKVVFGIRIILKWRVSKIDEEYTLGCFTKSTFQPKIKGIPSRIPPGYI